MDKLVRSKKSEYYLDFLNNISKEGYEFEYRSEEIEEGVDKICLRLNIDCEVYVLGEGDRSEIVNEFKDYCINFGFDSQSISIYIINKDKFFDKYIVPLKKELKSSSIGKNIQAVNFYRKNGSEIYPPEVSISIKPNIQYHSEEWFKICIELKMFLDIYLSKNRLTNLEYITPMTTLTMSHYEY